jgi:hypothetical protein
MTTKNRTAITLYIPDDWLEAIEQARDDTARTEWILESMRLRVKKQTGINLPEAPGRGRPRIKDSEGQG